MTAFRSSVRAPSSTPVNAIQRLEEGPSLRVAVCDYSGHPFQVQLSRELAQRGHDLLHLHFADFQTPKGGLLRRPTDPPRFEIAAVSLGKPFSKHSLIRRRFQEIEVGRLIGSRIRDFEPDVAVLCNLPLDSLRHVVRTCRTANVPFVFWQQDIYSAAIVSILRRKFGPLGAIVGAYYRKMEQRALLESAAVIVIADDFVTVLVRDFGVGSEKIHLIENWAPLEDIVPRPKDTPWSRSAGLNQTEVVLYTGTLGMKHDPAQIIALADALKDRPRTTIVIVSEGPAADWIAAEAAAQKLPNLRVLPFQPFEAYSDVLGCADVLIAILEPEAGTFSVPSKVLSYLCAGKPTVLAAPANNLASRSLARSGAGVVTPPGDPGALVGAVKSLLDDSALHAAAAAAARSYAERAFAIGPIGDCFETILMRATHPVQP